ncbi:MAG: regulatory protein RecX, partial [Flavicella sp.]
QTFTLVEAQQKLEHFCAYQERCHQEVVEKLYKLNMIPEAQEQIIGHLITEGFLNESRFAQSFARGKFRIKKWGKIRITQELKQKNISAYNIKLGLKEVDDEMYLLTLQDLIQKKQRSLKETDAFKKKKKLVDYLLRQGYEATLIFDNLPFVD